MNKKTLEIFKLYSELSKLLGGDKEAIADLELLFKRHPEMFKDMKEVGEVIEKVLNKPEIIMNNPRAKSNKDYMVYKQLDNEKMGDVGIRRSDNINYIFHANKKKISELDRLKENIKKQMVGSPISYTQAQSLDGLVQKNISSASKDIVTNSKLQSQATQGEKVMDMLRQEYEENSNKQNKANKLRNKL